ncbi:hypothetical protein HC891_25020 [Candidatus Gracilibacteria bacterium]|nr:hypothetical protein [Candidatus Gracilibacteria bacterium]
MGAQYNLALAMYVLANSLLDELASHVPASRLIRLYRLWNDLVLRMAHGQQRDLQLGATALSGGADDLDAYQQIAQAKTGATFALAFGGTAILLTDDAATIATLTAVGESYGTLIQYGDDLRDAAQQPTHAATLPAVLRRLPHFADSSQQHLHAFWSYVLTTSVAAVQERLAEHPARMQTHIGALFAQVFEIPTRPPQGPPTASPRPFASGRGAAWRCSHWGAPCGQPLRSGQSRSWDIASIATRGRSSLSILRARRRGQVFAGMTGL